MNVVNEVSCFLWGFIASWYGFKISEHEGLLQAEEKHFK